MPEVHPRPVPRVDPERQALADLVEEEEKEEPPVALAELPQVELGLDPSVRADCMSATHAVLSTTHMETHAPAEQPEQREKPTGGLALRQREKPTG